MKINTNNLLKNIIEINPLKIGLYKLYLAKLPESYSYFISMEIVSKYNFNDLYIYFNSFNNYFDKIEISQAAINDTFILSLTVNDLNKMYEYLKILHDNEKYYNDKNLIKTITDITKIQNIVNLANRYMLV
jgi:hypothetical protein